MVNQNQNNLAYSSNDLVTNINRKYIIPIFGDMKTMKTICALLILHFSITNLYQDDTLIVTLCLVGVISAISIIYLTFKTTIKNFLKHGI